MLLYKKNKRIKVFFLVLVVLFLTLFIIPSILLNLIYQNNEIRTYSSVDLINYLMNENNYGIQINNNNNIIYGNILTIDVNIEDFNNYDLYVAELSIDNNVHDEYIIQNKQENLDIKIDNEGKKNISIKIKKNNEIIYNFEQEYYIVFPYEKQYLDELSQNGIAVHYRKGEFEDYSKSGSLLKNLGVKYIRTDFYYDCFKNENSGTLAYDKWINDLLSTSDIKILAIINGNSNSNKIIDTEEEIKNTEKQILNIYNRYNYKITDYEIINEPNFRYITDEYIEDYSNLAESLGKNLGEDLDIYVASTNNNSEVSTDKFISSTDFYKKLLNSNANNYNINYSMHPYSFSGIDELKRKISEHKQLLNEYGGFNKLHITEYGTTLYYVTDEEQAEIDVKQTVTMGDSVDIRILYNLWTTSSEPNGFERFGILTNDYLPRVSYYAMKNYYENTNGAEYVGTVNLADGLEAHVYDKDGKAKIITWSADTESTISIPYENFTARDLYGNEIDNTEGTLEITTSPVYLDDISDSYFYEAISNTALSGYSEFEEKFSSEIESVPGLSSEIDSLKSYMSSLNGATTESEEVAKQKMASHYNLGNMILDAYRNRDLNIEYVTISSMLDMLNDIGNSYEDLVTVSAVTREPYYTATDELISSAENVMDINSDLNIVYPSKILDFAKELDEKSEYINSLTEENDIKTGLIVSNSLHSYYLADWANEFAMIYRDEYIEANPVTVSYSNTSEWTNEDVIATLNIGDDSKVTNNNGSNTYTFNDNGTFTFEYERRGQAYKIEASVSNIDKEPPTITGVEDRKIYTNSAKPVIEDDNIESIFIRFNDTTIDYEEGIELTEEGIYNITAMDKAGNVTTMEFYIVDEGPNGYIIQDNYILNVWQKTSLTDFEENFNLHQSYTIKRNDVELTESDIVATGDILELSSGDRYTIIVAGDINSDGRVSVFDLSILRRYILRLQELTELQALAADINVDGKELSVQDYSRMRIEILGIYSEE